MRRAEGRLSISGKMKGTAVALTLCGSTAVAADYACDGWDVADMARIEALSIGKSMITLRAASGPAVTVRMAQGTLTRRIYLDEGSALVIHGDFVRGETGPEFGPRVTLQRLMHDSATPILATTTCEASQ
ncbi:hypothetical protein [Pseudooceanicola onchidii]|uniref:hypothetical protein n=1 Tax=Pseudooceanicola onchidii TaxID=2562279 RepID=UPI00145B3E43|nr:hypothetical protein [Pseudooceanicola onchidii]